MYDARIRPAGINTTGKKNCQGAAHKLRHPRIGGQKNNTRGHLTVMRVEYNSLQSCEFKSENYPISHTRVHKTSDITMFCMFIDSFAYIRKVSIDLQGSAGL